MDTSPRVVPTCVRVARRALSGFFAANVAVVRCQCTQRDPLNDDDGDRLREVRRPRVVVVVVVVVAMRAIAMMRVIVRFAPQHALAVSFVLSVVDWCRPLVHRTRPVVQCGGDSIRPASSSTTLGDDGARTRGVRDMGRRRTTHTRRHSRRCRRRRCAKSHAAFEDDDDDRRG
jgi:hypothetical protein